MVVWSFGIIAALVLFSAAMVVPVREVHEQIDPVTGAERETTGEIKGTLLLDWVQRRDAGTPRTG